jgi:hypothetical protein
MTTYRSISIHSPATLWLRRAGMLCLGAAAAAYFWQPTYATFASERANEDTQKEARR